MKQFQLLLFGLFVCCSINAQNDLTTKQKDFLKLLQDKDYPQVVIVDNQFAAKLNPKAVFLYETNKGKVYALPLDNMLCLVTGIRSKMPVAKDFEQNFIPNALRKNKIITTPLPSGNN